MVHKSENLILSKEKLIESLWEYRWWLLENNMGMIIKIVREKQYKRPDGQHKKINPRDITKAKNKGLNEWLSIRRGYKDIFKWYALDSMQELGAQEFLNKPNEKHIIPIGFYNYTWNNKNELEDFETLTKMRYEELIGLSFAILTYFSRYQPLGLRRDKAVFGSFHYADQIAELHLKPLKDISLGTIRNELKAWAKDDTHELDEEMAFETFNHIHMHRESDWIKQQCDLALADAMRGFVEDYSRYDELDKQKLRRREQWGLEALHYWENGFSKTHLLQQRTEGYKDLYFQNPNEYQEKQLRKIQRQKDIKAKNERL